MNSSVNQPILYNNSNSIMSVVRRLLDDLNTNNLADSRQLSNRISITRQKLNSLTLSQLQQFIRQMSHLLYQKQQSANSQIFILQLIKELLLGGSFPLFLFLNVYIFPWVVSLNRFQRGKKLKDRAALFYDDLPAHLAHRNSANLLTYQQLLTFAEEFMVFFGQNLKFHPYSKFKIRSMLSRQLLEGGYSRSLSYFTQNDTSTLQSNLREYSNIFKQHLKQLMDFISDKVQQCIINQTCYHDNLYLLLSLSETSESYCITGIIHRLAMALRNDQENLLVTCQIIHHLVSTAEIETIEAVNVRCVPFLLQYLLPVDFQTAAILNDPIHIRSSDQLSKLIDYFYIWFQKTKMINLSDKIYDAAFGVVNQLKKTSKILYHHELKDFAQKIQSMKPNNQVKRSFIIDQNQQTEAKIVQLIKQVSYCISSQKLQAKPQTGFSNVLDDLTISEQCTHKNDISAFSQSLLRSVGKRQNGQMSDASIVSNQLRGPPHKKFGSSQNSLMTSRKSRQSAKSKQSSKRSNKDNKMEDIQNIYYTGALQRDEKRYQTEYGHSFEEVVNTSNQQSQKEDNWRHTNKSQKQVMFPSAPRVHARDTSVKKSIKSSPKQSVLSLHSSQFSQKQNNLKPKDQQIQSIYLSKDRKQDSKDKSGQFVYFQKDSQIKTQKNNQSQQQGSMNVNQQIEFTDSLKLDHRSLTEQIIQYGMDKDAKLPPTIKKPKFSFKNIDTNDSSQILKGLQSEKQSIINRIETPKSPKKQMLTINNTKDPSTIHKNRDQKILTPNRHSYKSQTPKNQKETSNIEVHVPRSIYHDKIIYNQSNSSASQIKQHSGQPHLMSESVSLSFEKIPSKFGSLFRKKQEKASVLSSSRSLQRLCSPMERQVQIPDLKKLRNLQNQLGKIKKQTHQYNKMLNQKHKQIIRLQKQKKQSTESDPYFLKKQNEIMKILLQNRQKEPVLLASHNSAKTLNRQLKESTIKNYNMSLKDYNTDILKLKLSNITGFQKQYKKHIIGNRCILLKNKLMQVGYSFKNKSITLYFTLKQYCDSMEINLIQNSMELTESIQRAFDKVIVGKQIKFKTEVKTTKNNNKFQPSILNLKLTHQQKLSTKNQQFNCTLPLTPYNIAKPLTNSQATTLQSRLKHQTTHYITPLYNSSDDLIKKGKPYLLNIFPHGQFNEDEDIFSIAYDWKQKIQQISVKIKERSFRLEGIGHPLESGRQLIETVVNLLIDNSDNF